MPSKGYLYVNARKLIVDKFKILSIWHAFLEVLKRLEFTSSEDEFLDYEDAKENCVDLNRRRSKMGKFSNRTPAKRSRSSKRRSYPESKVGFLGNKVIFSSFP